MLLAGAAFTVACGLALPRLRADYDPRSFHPQGTPLVAATRRAEAVFGADDQTALVALLDPQLFSVEGLARVDRLTRALGGLPGVERVTSLTNAPTVTGDGELLAVAPRLDPLPRSPEEADAARRGVLSDPNLAGILAAQDGTACLLLVEVLESWSPPARRAELYDRLQATLAPYRDGQRNALIGGFPMVRVQYSRELLSETLRLFAVTGIALVVLVTFMLRSIPAGLGAVGVVAVANVWTHGVMAWLGEPMTILSMLTPIVVLIVGVADAVHVVLAFRREPGADPAERAAAALRAVAPAGFITSVCTALGFVTLLTAYDVRMLRVFGVYTAIGVLAAWLSTVILIPMLLVRFGGDYEPERPRPISTLTERLVRRPWRVLAASGVVMLAITAAAMGISTDARLLDGLAADHPIMQTYTALESRFGGSLPLQVVYEGPPERLTEPDVLQHMALLTAELRALPETGAVRSPHERVAELHGALTGTPPRLPTRGAEIAELLMAASFADRDPFEGLFAESAGMARVSALLHERGSHATIAVGDHLQAWLTAHPLPGVTTSMAGTAWVAPRAWERLLDDMIWSSVLAVLLITALFAVLYRSVWVALLTIPPNIVPLVCVLAAMRFLDIPVKGNNAVVFSIAYGVAVDDTIYFVAHLRHLWQAGGMTWREAVVRAHHEMAGPLVTTSVVLALGFCAFLTSTFEFSVTLGLQMLVCVSTGALAELVMMPALLCLWTPKAPGPRPS